MKSVFTLLIILMLPLSLFAQDDLARGKQSFNDKNYDEAIALFQKFLSNNSRNVEANFYLGESYRLKGDFPNAQKSLERTLDFDDEYEPALASIIRVYGKLRMWDKAQKQYNNAMKYHKKGTMAPLAFAQTYLETDSLDKASIYFSKLKEIDEKAVEAYVGLSEVYSRQNVIVLAVDNLRTATQLKPDDPALWYLLATTILKNRSLNADQIREIIAALQKSIDLDPTNKKAIYDAAVTFYKIKYWREAAEFFKKYHDIDAKNAEATELYAISLYNARVYQEAVPVIEEALKNDPKSLVLQQMLAHSLYVLREYKKSVDRYAVIPVDSLSKDDVYRIGYANFQLKDTVKAISFLEKTLKLDPDYSDAIGTLAAIYLNQKKYDLAVLQYERLLAKDPNNIVALFYAGFSYYVLGKNDTAKGYFKQLVALRPNNMQSHQQLVQIYSLQDSSDQGRYHANVIIQLADSAMKAEPERAAQHAAMAINAYHMVGVFDYKEKNIKGAIEKLEKAAAYEKEKKDEGLHLFLAQMYAVMSGDKELLAAEAKQYREKACREYLLVLKINPRNAAAKKESAQMNCGK
jgi:tetratricopeptide (TPR) repeat protein